MVGAGERRHILWLREKMKKGAENVKKGVDKWGNDLV